MLATRLIWRSRRVASILAVAVHAARESYDQAHLKAESNTTVETLRDGEGGPQFGPGTKAVDISWTAQTCGQFGCGAESYVSLKFNLGTFTVKGRQVGQHSIRRLKKNECLSDCKVTGKSCNSLMSVFQTSREKKFYVAGARDYGGANNAMIYWDYKLCCEVAECSGEGSWTVNYNVLDPPQPVQLAKYARGTYECMCCDAGIQCETLSVRGSPLWEADKRCAEKDGLTRVEQLNEHCEAAFKVRSAPIKVKTELDQYFRGTAMISKTDWWDRCAKICATRGRSVPKTASLS